jgi:predicted Rossmann fold nucleotide-binding protein DprA/Smf involved in DNA uptake
MQKIISGAQIGADRAGINAADTVIFTDDKLCSGSSLTAKFAPQHNRPYLHSTHKQYNQGDKTCHKQM